jgi:hypothetical protein
LSIVGVTFPGEEQKGADEEGSDGGRFRDGFGDVILDDAGSAAGDIVPDGVATSAAIVIGEIVFGVALVIGFARTPIGECPRFTSDPSPVPGGLAEFIELEATEVGALITVGGVHGPEGGVINASEDEGVFRGGGDGSQIDGGVVRGEKGLGLTARDKPAKIVARDFLDGIVVSIVAEVPLTLGPGGVGGGGSEHERQAGQERRYGGQRPDDVTR